MAQKPTSGSLLAVMNFLIAEEILLSGFGLVALSDSVVFAIGLGEPKVNKLLDPVIFLLTVLI